MGIERRKHPRTELRLLVQYRSDSFDTFLAEYASNLSPGGIFLRTDSPHPLGSTIFLQFFLADGSKLIEGMGQVVRVNEPTNAGREPGMGIEFTNFDEASMTLIEEVCVARAAKRNRPD
jgi:molecular chaperone DnaK